MKKLKYIFALLLCGSIFSMSYAQTNCETDYVIPDNITSSLDNPICANNLDADIVIEAGVSANLLGVSTYLNNGFMIEEGASVLLNECIAHVIATQQIELSSNIQISPNPTTGLTTLEIDLQEATNLELYLTDALGKVVLHIDNETTYLQGKNTINLDLQKLPVGIYLLQMTDGKRLSSRKIVKQ